MKKIWLGVLLVVAVAAGWYFYGQQTPPMDVVSAARLPLLELQRAAERGEPAAQYMLGLRYETGEGGIKEPVLAVSWYRKAAEQGLADAQQALGYNYYKGVGETRDLASALHWFQLAAEQGMRDAQYVLGDLYENGRGVSADLEQAYAWYALAAAGGQPAAKKAQEALIAKMPAASLAQARTLAAEYAHHYGRQG